MPAEFVDALADELVASGVGARYSDSGSSIQVNLRRELGQDHTILLRQTGGLADPWSSADQGRTEQYAVQVLVDSIDLVSGQVLARQVFNQFHGRKAETISGHQVLWLRSTSGPPQALPLGPTGQAGRYQFSVNFDAVLKT